MPVKFPCTRVGSLLAATNGSNAGEGHNRIRRNLLRPYKGTSPIKKLTPLGPYRRPMPRVLGGFQGGGRFVMSEAPL